MLDDGICAFHPTAYCEDSVPDGCNLISSPGHGGPEALSPFGHNVMVGALRSEKGGAHAAVNTCGGGEPGLKRY